MIDSKVGSNFQITGIGEVLWNVFPDGKRFGGKPSNFACQAQALGANAHIVNCVGQNQLGQKSYHSLETRQINTSSIAFSDQHSNRNSSGPT